MYEESDDDLICHEPIYYRQYKTLKRLTKLPDDKLLSFTSEEATLFINTFRRKRENWDYLKAKREVVRRYGIQPREKFIERMNEVQGLTENKAEERQNGQLSSQCVVVASQVQIFRTKSK